MNMSVIPYGRGIRAFGVTLLFVAFTVPVLAQPGELGGPPFDPRQVVERARAGRGMERRPESVGSLGFDDGEFLIDTSRVAGLTPGDQKYPAVSFDGTNYFVVWEDSSRSNIYGARVNQAGAVLDPFGIPISTATGRQYSPAVSFDDTNFLVVWADRRSGSYSDIYGTRVSQAGTVLDLTGFPISLASDFQENPAISFDGVNFLVTWRDSRNNPDYGDIYGARVTQAGAVLDPYGIAISQAANTQGLPAVSFGGTNFLVVWEDPRSGSYSDIYGARVSQAGAVLDSSGIAISTAAQGQYSPAASFDGTNFLVVWQDERNAGWDDIYGARVATSGTVLDPTGVAIGVAANYQRYPAVSYDGTRWLVVWQDSRGSTYVYDIYGARVTSSGTVLDSAGIAISTAADGQLYPAVSFDGTNRLVVWADKRSGAWDIYGARVSQAGAVLDPTGFPASTAPYPQESPAVSFDGTNFLVVWQDYWIGHSYFIYGARVSQAGAVLDPLGIPISTAANANTPAVSFDGTDYLVVWERGYIYGARVSQAGTVLDPTGIPISMTSGWTPDVSFNGTNFLVVWKDQRGDPDIYGSRVSTGGTVLDPFGIPISPVLGSQAQPVLGFDGTNWLAVWTDEGRGEVSGIYGARVSQSGTVLDTASIPISTATNAQNGPAVSFDGASWLAVWQDARGGSGYDIYGARVSQAGTVLDPTGIRISSATNDQRYPAVFSDGTNSRVVWQDYRNQRDTSDIYGARVRPNGTVFDEGQVVGQAGSQVYPALARDSSQMFLVYQGWAGPVGSKTYNAYRIWGKFEQFVGVEERRQPTAYSSRPIATIVRGVLFLPPASGVGRGASSVLLDISGRAVLDLRPGANDVRRLSPGVYFVRSGRAPTTTKVVVQK